MKPCGLGFKRVFCGTIEGYVKFFEERGWTFDLYDLLHVHGWSSRKFLRLLNLDVIFQSHAYLI